MCINFQYTIMLDGGCNLAQLTTQALYFNCAALEAVHYFAER